MQAKYPAKQIFFHWLTFILIILTYASIQARDLDITFDWYDLMMNTHFSLGICVWITVFIRLILRHIYSKQTPEITPTPPLWQSKLAHYIHLLLYLLFLLVPLLGSLTVLNKGFDLAIFGYPLFSGFKANPETAYTLKETHEWLANTAMLLVALHAAAALFHHYVVKDNTLLRIMPYKHK